MDRVALPLRRDAGDEEAGQSPAGLGEGQERIAHGGGAEPFMAGQAIGAATQRRGAGGVGAHVAAALLFGHRHADRDARLFSEGFERRIVAAADQLFEPGGCDVGLRPEYRDAGIGHVDRAHDAGLGLGEKRQQGGVGDVATGGLRPGDVVDAVCHRQRHQLMPGGVKAHLVDAAALAVESGQFGRIAVGLCAKV